ncbi:MAG: hypothetical protein WD696_19495 [Bryobacteraceae bacterium]
METTFRGRRAVTIQNDVLRVTVLCEGGHVAEIADTASEVNPLWIPPWPSIEPSRFDPKKHPEYGSDAESRLLAGIMGHNLCLDIFGGPSDAEAAAGLTVHGEGSVASYEIRDEESRLTASAELPLAQLRFERRIALVPGSRVVQFTEVVENLLSFDRPLAWTQHATLGPPFLEKGQTQFRLPATRSKVYETDFAAGKGTMRLGAEFDWPHVPAAEGRTIDLRVCSDAPVSAGYTAHLMDPHREQAFFAAFTPRLKTLFGYVWRRADFPWLGIWEENHSREAPPWNGKALTRGMEFGVSPMPETRRKMVERGSLFGAPAYRWLPAKQRLQASYCAYLLPAGSIPDIVSWDGRSRVTAGHFDAPPEEFAHF